MSHDENHVNMGEFEFVCKEVYVWRQKKIVNVVLAYRRGYSTIGVNWIAGKGYKCSMVLRPFLKLSDEMV